MPGTDPPLTVLVTGAGGFIGSHCVLRLLELGFHVVAADNFVNCIAADEQHSMPESLIRVQRLTGKQLHFYPVDLKDPDAVNQLFTRYPLDCVVHLAALKAVSESCQVPLKYYANNVGGTINLLQAMMSHKVKKLVFSSSATVYGDPDRLPIDETHPTGKCANPYGRTKFFAEEIIKDVTASDAAFGAIILRYFNPIGAHPSGMIGEDPQGVPNNLMPYISQVAAKKRDKVSVFGNDYPTKDGTGIRDYIHIMDLAEGHVAALKMMFQEEHFSGVKVYNLGTGKGASVLDMIRAFEQAAGGVHIPYEIKDRRPGDVAECYASCDLARAELQWQAHYSLFEMCRDMWNWQAQNMNGFREK